MSQTVNLWGATYSNVPSVRVPKNAAKTEYATFADTSGTTATESDVASGKVFVKSDGSTASGSLSFSTIYTSTSNPSGGSNGDVWLKTVS